MAQNFWTASFRVDDLFCRHDTYFPGHTANKSDEELKGLVYSLTPRIKETDVPWYSQPATLGIIVCAGAVVLNIIFW